MAKVPAKSVRVYWDEFAFAGSLISTEQTVEQETIRVDTLDSSGPRRLVGNYDVMHADLGLFESADDGYDEELFASLADGGAEHYLTKCFAGDAEGNPCYDSVVLLRGEPRSGQVGGAVLLNFNSEGQQGVVRGTILANATVTGAGNRTGRNMGATTAGKVFAVVFRVLAFTGTTITLTVQESTDDGAVDPYAAIAGLADTFTAIGKSRKTTTAATEAWKRINIAGTFTSALIFVSAGVVQGT